MKKHAKEEMKAWLLNGYEIAKFHNLYSPNEIIWIDSNIDALIKHLVKLPPKKRDSFTLMSCVAFMKKKYRNFHKNSKM